MQAKARAFGQDLMRGEHALGAKTNDGVLMPSHTSGDPGFYAAKRAAEKEALRQQHELAKAEVRRQKAEQEAIRMEAARLAEEESEAERRGARKERKALTKAEQKAARDARHAGRKAVTR